MTDESIVYYGYQLAYSTDSYAISATYALHESVNTAGGEAETSYWGYNAYWTPSETGGVPSISVGYETGDPANTGTKETSQYFVGLQWDEVGPGTLGVAIGSVGAIEEDADELTMYEAFYSYSVNDSMTITPAIYSKETAGTADDETGILVKTSFSF